MGYFDDEAEAALTYDTEARKLLGVKARLNFPSVANGEQGSNTSKYRGVCWCKQKNKWEATFQKEKKRIHLGFFDDDDKAKTSMGAPAPA